MINLFCGYDRRESAGFHVFVHSVLKHSSAPVAITPIASCGVGEGSNAFTLSRFLVPYFMGFKGRAIFADASDMLMLGDVAELHGLFDKSKAVQVVKHEDYISAHESKYVGTSMECRQSNYRRKNWASLMLINCEHSAWFAMTPKALSLAAPIEALRFDHFQDQEIGGLPKEWNVLVDEGQSDDGAKLLHWTAGIPKFRHYRNARRSLDWFQAQEEMGSLEG